MIVVVGFKLYIHHKLYKLYLYRLSKKYLFKMPKRVIRDYIECFQHKLTINFNGCGFQSRTFAESVVLFKEE